MSSGGGSHATPLLATPRSRARSAVRASTSAWPRCMPSNVPTVTTDPLRARGSASEPSCIAHHHFGTPVLSVAHGHSQQFVVVAQRRDLSRGLRSDVLTVRHALGVQ